MRLTRREFLRQVGAGAATFALLGVLGSKLGSSLLQPTQATEGIAPQRLRRWTMVIDLKRCDGCIGLGLPPQCTTSCLRGHFIPVGMQWIEVFEREFERGGSYFFPVPCMQCENAPCVNVCPVGATFTTPEGVVLIDQKRCIGCRLCMAACPYSRRFFNWGNPQQPPQARTLTYSAETQTPAIRGTVMKCNFCPHLANAGVLPFCVAGCPRRALYFGDLEEDIATDGNEVEKLSRFLALNQAFRFKEELGTQPRVYYLPGYGQNAGRSPYQRGLYPVTWPAEWYT